MCVVMKNRFVYFLYNKTSTKKSYPVICDLYVLVKVLKCRPSKWCWMKNYINSSEFLVNLPETFRINVPRYEDHLLKFSLKKN